MKSISLLLGSIVFVTFVLLTGCGNDYGAPDGSTITISPVSIALADSRVSPPTIPINSQPIFVTVRNKDGLPIPGVTIFIFVPTTFSSQVGFRYNDGTPVTDTQFMAKTDDNGVYSFGFDYVSGDGESYLGDLAVSSNSAYSTMTFTITP